MKTLKKNSVLELIQSQNRALTSLAQILPHSYRLQLYVPTASSPMEAKKERDVCVRVFTLLGFKLARYDNHSAISLENICHEVDHCIYKLCSNKIPHFTR